MVTLIVSHNLVLSMVACKSIDVSSFTNLINSNGCILSIEDPFKCGWGMLWLFHILNTYIPFFQKK